ncbi:TPA: hypothetical protein ACT5CJ_001295 [Flavobacterium psychrophilum]
MDKLEIKKGILQSEPLNLTNSTKTEQTTKEDFEINTFNYKYFFDNIDNISYTHQLKLIQKETNNFDVFLLGQFYTEFFILVTSYKLDRIKFNDIDISFSQDIEANVFSDDNSLLSYIHYSIKKGKLIRKRTNIKFDLIEPIEIKYFMGLYDVLHHLEKIILNYATKEQLNNLEQKTLQLEPEAIDLNNASTDNENLYLGQPTNENANKLFDYLIEYYRPAETTVVKYVNILHYLKNDAEKKHFIFTLKQDAYKIIVKQKTGIEIKKFAKSEQYNEVEKPILYSLENSFLKNKTA